MNQAHQLHFDSDSGTGLIGMKAPSGILEYQNFKRGIIKYRTLVSKNISYKCFIFQIIKAPNLDMFLNNEVKSALMFHPVGPRTTN